MYLIVYSKKSEKFLKKLEKEESRRIIEAISRLKIKPQRYLTKLVGDPAYKLRVGDYRVLVDVQDSILIIEVIEVGHRRNIYKK